MLSTREPRTWTRGVLGAVVAIGVAVAALAATPAAKKTEAPVTPVFMGPEVHETSANLQNVFAGEVNAKERYLAAALQADRDGYPYVAQLFRACARAEQAHAEQHVHAIAWGGAEAKALLQRMALGTTEENLRASVNLETYEATQLYPALLARARADHNTAAVRSMNFALAAEREHARLLAAALATLDLRRATDNLYVCAQCGKTVESRSFAKCPNCFARASGFVSVK